MTVLLDEIAPSFRIVRDRWPNAPNIQAHYNALCAAYEVNRCDLIELCKSFLEMVCITILNEMGADVPQNNDTTNCVVTVLNELGVSNTRGASAFDRVLSAHNRLADALTTVRNQEGSVAHGRDGFIDIMSVRHAKIYLLSADTVLSLIMQAYDGVEPKILKTHEPYIHFNHHNERIDISTQIQAMVGDDGMLVVNFASSGLEDSFEIHASASELLYSLDRRAYVDVLEAIKRRVPEAEEESTDSEDVVDEPLETEAIEAPIPEEGPQEYNEPDLSLEPIETYEGQFQDHLRPLYDFIIHNVLSGNNERATEVLSFSCTLLNGMEELVTVDWAIRASTHSEVKLWIKKLVRMFNINGITSNSVDPIVTWLAERINGSNT